MFAKIAIISSIAISMLSMSFPSLNGSGQSAVRSAASQPRHIPQHALPMFAPPVTTFAATSAGNFPFQTVVSSDGKIILHAYDHDASYMQQLLSLVQTLLVHPIYARLQLSLVNTVNLYIYNTRSDFLQGTKISNPAETGAFATSNPSAIYVPITNINDPDTQDFLAHEMTHIVFHQNEDSGHLMDQTFRFFPLWLDEGMAASDESGSQVSDYNAALSDARSNHGYTDIFHDFISSYPQDPDTDFLSYAESRDFILYMQKQYGIPAFHQFLLDIKDGQFLQSSLKDFGIPIDLIEQQWAISTFPGTNPPAWGYWPAVHTAQSQFAAGSVPARATQTRFALLSSPELSMPQSWLTADIFVIVLFVILLLLVLFEQLRYQRYARKQQLYTAEHAGDVLQINEPGRNVSNVLPEISLLGGSTILLPAVVWGIIAIDPLHSYSLGYIAAGILSFALLLFMMGRMLLHYNDAMFSVMGRALSIVILAGMSLGLWVSAGNAALTQIRVYANAGYYSLAENYASSLVLYTSVQKSQQIAIHRAWYQQANQAHDYVVAVEQMQAILHYVPASAKDRQAYSDEVDSWTRALVHSGDLQQATQVYQDQLHWSGCVLLCQTHFQNSLADILLMNGDVDLAAGKVTDAQSLYSQIVQQYHSTTSYSAAKSALDNMASIVSLQTAFQKGGQGDIAGMNAVLKTLQSIPDSTGGHFASLAPEPVTGKIVDANGAGVAGDYIYFLGFATQSDADAFYSGTTPLNVNVFASTIGKGGAFSARLTPGYWYVALWDDSSQAQYNYLNGPQSNSSVFDVKPFTTQDVGTITGF